jgi:plastocyanin
MGRGICVAITALMLAAPASAMADKQIDATPPNRFSASEYTMDQGEKLVFHNGDTVAHDVTSSTQKDGKPLFRSELTDGGKSSTVDGAQYLTEGHYDFICSIHPNMKAQLHVTGNGTPQTRPGAAGPAGSTTPSNPSDKTAPKVGVKLVSKRLKAVRQGRKLRVRVTVNDETHVVLKAVARPQVGGPLVTVAKAETHLNKGTRRVSVPLTAKGIKALRGNRSTLAVIVTVKAIDNGGNKTTEQYGRTLRR